MSDHYVKEIEILGLSNESVHEPECVLLYDRADHDAISFVMHLTGEQIGAMIDPALSIDTVCSHFYGALMRTRDNVPKRARRKKNSN